MAVRNKKGSRAEQFLPFNALRGYYDLVRKVEKKKEPKKILSDEELDLLSLKIKMISKGMVIKVTYYNIDGYETVEGMNAGIDDVYRTITIVKKVIPIDDIIDIDSEKIKKAF